MKRTNILILATMLSGGLFGVFGHPGSGIVVDRQGHVYFVDTGSGIWKIERNGALTRLRGPAYHWMAIDADRRLQNVSLPYFSSGDATVARADDNSSILVASDFPVNVARDGALYYPWLTDGTALQIFRLAPSGTTTVFKTLPGNQESGRLRWLNGMATGPDGSVYFSENRAIRKITPQGQLETVVENLTLPRSDSVPGVGADLGPYLRGLDIDAQGTVYVAATGCGAVIKISTDKSVSTVLRAESPWSPTGVAVFGSDLYVLEYFHTVGDNRREWYPRIRRLSPGGHVVTVATIERR